MNMACPFQSGQHQLISPPMLEWARANCPDKEAAKKLFMYRHLQHGTFVIALWVKEGWFVDILNLGTSLANFTREKAQAFLRQFGPGHTTEALKEHFREVDSRFRHHETDKSTAYHDRFQRVRSTATRVGYGG